MKFLKLLFDIRTKGMKVLATDNYSKAEKAIIVAVILHLLSKGSLMVKEIKEGGSIASVIVVTDEAKLAAYKCDTSETIVYENKNSQIEELFSKLHLGDAYIEYKNRWTVPTIGGYRSDVDNEKKAKEFLNTIKPVVNEDGQLLLAEDSEGNTVWAYVLRHKNNGSVSYGIYRRDYDGRPSKTEWISPAVVSEMGTKLGNIIKNYEGRFNSKNAIDATLKLWCWNLIKTYEIQNKIDDYDPLDIYEELKEWIINNAGKSFKHGEEIFLPVYINELKGRVDIGIWSDNLEFVFEKLEIEEKPKEWLGEAVKEHWIIPQLKKDGSVARSTTNTSNFQREAFKRKNKNERFYKFSLNDEEVKEAVRNYHINTSMQMGNYIECDLDKEVE